MMMRSLTLACAFVSGCTGQAQPSSPQHEDKLVVIPAPKLEAAEPEPEPAPTKAPPKVTEEQIAEFERELNTLAQTARSNKGNADGSFRQVIALWKRSENVIAALEPKPLGQAIEVVGEAHYHFAEKKRLAVERITLAPMKGQRTRIEVDRYVKTKMKEWVDKKRKALRDAEKAYLEIVKLKPVPPPKWTIPSAMRVGDMRFEFMSEFRAAPYPSEWDKPGNFPGTNVTNKELRETFVKSLEAASQGELRAALGAYQTCVRYAEKFGVDNEDVRHCAAQVDKLRP